MSSGYMKPRVTGCQISTVEKSLIHELGKRNYERGPPAVMMPFERQNCCLQW